MSGALPVRAAGLLLALALSACATTGEKAEPPRAGVTPPPGAVRSRRLRRRPTGASRRAARRAGGRARARGRSPRAIGSSQVALTIRRGTPRRRRRLRGSRRRSRARWPSGSARGAGARARRAGGGAPAVPRRARAGPRQPRRLRRAESDTKEVAFIAHTVGSGDTWRARPAPTTGTVALRGIWETNQLPPIRGSSPAPSQDSGDPGVPFVQRSPSVPRRITGLRHPSRPGRAARSRKRSPR